MQTMVCIPYKDDGNRYHFECVLHSPETLQETYSCLLCTLKKIMAEKRQQVFYNAIQYIPNIVNEKKINEFLLSIDDTIPTTEKATQQNQLKNYHIPHFKEYISVMEPTPENSQLFIFTGEPVVHTIVNEKQWVQCSLLFISHYNHIFKHLITKMINAPYYPIYIDELVKIAKGLHFDSSDYYHSVLSCYNHMIWFYSCLELFHKKSSYKSWSIVNNIQKQFAIETNEVSIYISKVYRIEEDGCE